MKKYRPMGTCVIVKIEKVEEYSGGGILLTNVLAEKEQMAREEGIVIAKAAMAGFDGADDFQVGNLVAFARFGGKHLGYDDDKNEIRIMKDIDILCVIEEE